MKNILVRSQTRRAAFTLIELLVVVSVIAVLAGLTFSVVGSAQRKGAATRELHVARQLMAADLNYAAERDGELLRGYDKAVKSIDLPSGRTVTGEMCSRYPWRLASYLGEQVEEVFLLGENRRAAEGLARDSFEYQDRASLHPALGLNAYCVGGYEDGQAGLFQKDVVTRLVQAVRPAQFIVFASARMKQSATDEEIDGDFLIKPPLLWRTKWARKYDAAKPSSRFGNVALRWSDHAVCAFLDGSVRTRDATELRDMRRWSNTAAENDDPDFVVPR